MPYRHLWLKTKRGVPHFHFGPFEMSGGLKRELYHLRDIGYVDVVSVGGIPQRGEDLSQHVRVTDAGRDFVRLRESISDTPLTS